MPAYSNGILKETDI